MSRLGLLSLAFVLTVAQSAYAENTHLERARVFYEEFEFEKCLLLLQEASRAENDAATLVAFFEARRGRLHGFRFKDFADFRSCAPSGVVGAFDQALGEGDGTRTDFQLVKLYGDVARPIRKPVEGSVRAAVDGVEE